MFNHHRQSTERVFHTEETKQQALAAWRDNPTRPKAAIARFFGIPQSTFNMWTNEAAYTPKGRPVPRVAEAPKTTYTTNELLMRLVIETRRIADALERRR